MSRRIYIGQRVVGLAIDPHASQVLGVKGLHIFRIIFYKPSMKKMTPWRDALGEPVRFIVEGFPGAWVMQKYGGQTESSSTYFIEDVEFTNTEAT